MKPFEMAFPESVEEACELLAQHDDCEPIAGGTALTTVMKEGVYHPDILVNLRGLEDTLGTIEDEGDSIRIGALATLREIETDETIQEHFPTVSDCLSKIAGVRVRNSATLGGHLAHADIHLDLPPVLEGYNAAVVVTDGSETRELSVAEFMQGYYETDLDDGELITEIRVPKPGPDTVGTYLKHRYYSEVDWPCVGVAVFAVHRGDRFEDVRVLLNSVSQAPVLEVDDIETVTGGELTDDEIEAVAELAAEQSQPIDDIRGSAAYKERMTSVFTERALKEITRRDAQ